MGWEIRYRGELLSRHHESEEAAELHARRHHGWGRESDSRPAHHVEDVEHLTIEPPRPVHLHCRGNLVETFRTTAAARAYVDKHATPRMPEEVWTVLEEGGGT